MNDIDTRTPDELGSAAPRVEGDLLLWQDGRIRRGSVAEVLDLPPVAGAYSRANHTGAQVRPDIKTHGAVANGFASDLDAFTAFALAPSAIKELDNGIYALSAAWQPAADDFVWHAGAKVKFAGAGRPNFATKPAVPGVSAEIPGMIPYQGGPIWSQHFIRKAYKTSDGWSGYGNIFHGAFYARSEIPSYSLGGGNVVSLFSGAEASGANSSVWATNFVAYANSATSNAIGIELNYGSLVDGGKAYGIVIASAGFAAPGGPAIQIQSNNTIARPPDGIKFHNRSWGCVTGALLRTDGPTDVAPANIGIDFSLHEFPVAELWLKSFKVDATPPGTVNQVRIRGAATGGAPALQSYSTIDADVNLILGAQGSGVLLFTAAGIEQMRVQGDSTTTDNVSIQGGTGGTVNIGARGATANIDVMVTGKGSGGGRLRDGSGNNIMRWNAVGVGFNGVNPLPKPTLPAAASDLASAIALANANRSTLINYGLAA